MTTVAVLILHQHGAVTLLQLQESRYMKFVHDISYNYEQQLQTLAEYDCSYLYILPHSDSKWHYFLTNPPTQPPTHHIDFKLLRTLKEIIEFGRKEGK